MRGSIAIIIPTLNSPTLGAVIAATQAQMADRGHIDLVVVGRDDSEAAIRAGARFVAGDRTLNPAEARNLGIRSTSAEYLIFLDSDCVPEPGWLAAMTSHVEDEQIVSGGAMRLVPDRYLRLAGNVSTFHEYTTALLPERREFLPTFSLGVNRQAIARCGAFDERLPRAEDLDFTIRLRRAGYALCFDPSAAVIHRPQRLSWAALAGHAILSGQCSIRVRRKYPEAFAMPAPLLDWRILLAVAPFVALMVPLKAFYQNPDVRQHWLTLPVFVLSRYLWIIGACQYLRTEAAGQSASTG